MKVLSRVSLCALLACGPSIAYESSRISLEQPSYQNPYWRSSGRHYGGTRDLSDCGSYTRSRLCYRSSCGDDQTRKSLEKAYYRHDTFLGVASNIPEEIFWSERDLCERLAVVFENLFAEIAALIMAYKDTVPFRYHDVEPVVTFRNGVSMIRSADSREVFVAQPFCHLYFAMDQLESDCPRSKQLLDAALMIIDEINEEVMDIVSEYRYILDLSECQPVIELSMNVYLTEEMIETLVQQKLEEERFDELCGCDYYGDGEADYDFRHNEYDDEDDEDED